MLNTEIITKINKEKQNLKNKTKMVSKSNDLILNTKLGLSAIEQKLLAYTISKIAYKADDLSLLNLKIKDILTALNLSNGGRSYLTIKEAFKALRDKSCWIKVVNEKTNKTKDVSFSWFTKVIIDEDHTGEVTVFFDELLKPHLINLQKRFTTYELIYIVSLTSKYSIRLYEILKSFEFKKNITIKVDEIKVLLNTNSEDFRYLRRKALDPAIKEINEFTDLQVDICFVKEGRKISEICFNIEKQDYYNRFINTKKQNKEEKI